MNTWLLGPFDTPGIGCGPGLYAAVLRAYYAMYALAHTSPGRAIAAFPRSLRGRLASSAQPDAWQAAYVPVPPPSGDRRTPPGVRFSVADGEWRVAFDRHLAGRGDEGGSR